MKTSNRCKSPTLNWFLIGSLLLFVLIASTASSKKNNIEGLTTCSYQGSNVDPGGYEYYVDDEGNFKTVTNVNGDTWRHRQIVVKKQGQTDNEAQLMPYDDAINRTNIENTCSNHHLISVPERHNPEKLYASPDSADYDYMQKLAAVRFGVPVIDIPDGFLPNPHVKYSEGNIGSELSSIVKDEVHDNIWCKAPSTYTPEQKERYCSRDTPHPANLFMKV